MLVDQAMVERAHQREVAQLGRAALRPPHEVVRVGERGGSTPGEPTSRVAVSQLAKHPGRRLTTHRRRGDHLTILILFHALDPRVASQTRHGGGMQHRTVLDLSGGATGCGS